MAAHSSPMRRLPPLADQDALAARLERVQRRVQPAQVHDMRAITVKQPWAWAIIYGGKAVENRGRREPWHTAIGERIAIHAGKSRDEDGCYDPLVRGAWRPADPALQALVNVEGAILGTAFLTGIHHASVCLLTCSGWAQPDQWHLMLTAIEPWSQPVAARGALGLWTVPEPALTPDAADSPTTARARSQQE